MCISPLLLLVQKSNQGVEIFQQESIAPDDSYESSDGERGLGFREAVLPDQGLEPEKIGPGVLLLVRSLNLGKERQAGFDLALAQDAVEARDKFYRASHGVYEPLYGGRGVELDDPVQGDPRGCRNNVESVEHLA